MFWIKKNEKDTRASVMDPDSYAKLLHRIVERDAEVTTLKSKVNALELDIQSIRSKLSAKLRDLQKEHNQERTEETLNTSDSVYFG